MFTDRDTLTLALKLSMVLEITEVVVVHQVEKHLLELQLVL